MKNYLKTSHETGCRIIFFNDSFPEDVNRALTKALQIQARHADMSPRGKRYDPVTRITIWRRCSALNSLREVGEVR